MGSVIISVKERKFHANFTFRNESSTYGTFVPRERKFSGTKVPWIWCSTGSYVRYIRTAGSDNDCQNTNYSAQQRVGI